MLRWVGDNSACGGAERPGIPGIVGAGRWLGSLVVGCGGFGCRGGGGGGGRGGGSAMVEGFFVVFCMYEVWGFLVLAERQK